MREIKNRLLALFFILLTGCSYSERASPLCSPVVALQEAQDNALQNEAFQESEGIPSDWWNLFGDEQLNCFIQTAFARNPTLQAAQANILMAVAAAEHVRAALFPNIWWGGDISRQKLSKTGVIPFGEAQTVPVPRVGVPIYFTQYETQLNLTYDFDLWGKNRNTFRAALSEVQARLADEVFSRLQLGIAVARAYFQLQIEYRREKIAKALVENRTKYAQLIKKRVAGNLTDQLIRQSSEFDLTGARESLLQIQGNIAVTENQLHAYLAGNFEEAICFSYLVDKPLPKVPLPRELPLHLIAHRPDITAQLWLIESAGRQIDVAKASFYPDFNITALFGFQTIHFRELLKWPSTYFNIDPAFTLPLFDGGLRRADLHASEVNYDLAIFHYNELVLNAVREVLDGLAILKNNSEQWEEYKKQLTFQEENLRLTSLRIKHHIDSGIDYLVREQSVLVAEDQEIIALGNTLQAILSLIKALGGGYQAC